MRTRMTKTAGVAAVVMVLGLSTTAIASHQFTDVDNTNIFHDDIAWMYDNAITFGYGDGTYGPDDNVTRGQMAAFMHRLYNRIGQDIPEVPDLSELIALVENEVNIDIDTLCDIFALSEADCAEELAEVLRGPSGVDGVDGEDGVDGAPGVSGYTVLNAEERWGPSTGKSETQFLCPDGKVALGGGYEVDGTANGSAVDTVITDNGPVWSNFKALGWRASGIPSGEVNVKVWAVCANVAN